LKFKISLILITLILTFNLSGNVELKNNIETIKNPNKPALGEISFKLKLDLSISGKKFDFYEINMIAIDNKENIYALDQGNCCIFKFNKNGKYIMKIGRKGQGPGEFTYPSCIFIDDYQNIYVSDYNRRIHIFDKNGRFLKNIPLKYSIFDFFIDSENNIIAVSRIATKAGPEKAILKFNDKGEKIKEIAKFSDVKPAIRKSDKGTPFVLTVYHRYNYWPYLYPLGEGEFVYAYPKEYKIFIMNTDGDLKLIIEKEEVPQPINRKEKNFIIKRIENRLKRRGRKFPRKMIEEACQFPRYRPFFKNILADDKGRIYVQKMKSVIDKSKEVEFDIFSKDGHYLYKTKFPFTPEIIRKGYVFNIYSSDETSETKIERYKIKNWSEIKVLF